MLLFFTNWWNYSLLSYLRQVHGSENGKHFRSKLQSEHIELLQSPWLIELGAFCLNLDGAGDRDLPEISGQFFCDVNATPPVMTMLLPDSRKLNYDLTCAICLVRSYFWLSRKWSKNNFFMLVSDLCLIYCAGHPFQSVCFELWSSLLQVMRLLCRFRVDLPRTKSCKPEWEVPNLPRGLHLLEENLLSKFLI